MAKNTSRLSLKFWVTIITIVLLAIVIFFSRDQMVKAWIILSKGSVNFWVLALLLPVQFISYFARGKITYLYLRAKREKISLMQMVRIALETNFVDHVAVINGLAGAGYLSWRLSHNKISPGRSVVTQAISYSLTLACSIIIIVISVISLILEKKAGILIVTISIALVLIIGSIIAGILYIISGHSQRIIRISIWLAKASNRIASIITRGKKYQIISPIPIQNFFNSINKDYVEIVRDKRVLVRPFFWALLAIILDASLIWIVFLALGVWVNPAVIFIAFSLSSYASVLAFTPGGAGVYETCMIAFLATANVPVEVAIAGTLLARALLLAINLLAGYVFYQKTINKYGKPNQPNTKEELNRDAS